MSNLILRFVVLISCCTLFWAPRCFADTAEVQQPASPLPSFSALKHTSSGRVDKVINALTITLKDGKIVRLASLDIPDFAHFNESPYADAAYKKLVELLPEGTEIMLYQTRNAKKGRINRMNHQLAHIVTKKSNIWIHGELLSAGLARVVISPNAPEMVMDMIKLENQARHKQKAIWASDSPYKVYNAAQTDLIPHKQFVVIEGTVTKAANIKNNVYLNFGQDWKTDFTIMVKPALRKKLAQKNIHALSLGHKTLRVRGWVRDYNGPFIELEVPQHLEYPISQVQNEDEKK